MLLKDNLMWAVPRAGFAVGSSGAEILATGLGSAGFGSTGGGVSTSFGVSTETVSAGAGSLTASAGFAQRRAVRTVVTEAG